MVNNEIMVSVSCTTFNHEKYIRQCLESLLMQKTNFKYEIIVHDDASTDNTANIIREYEKKYPEIIKPIYQLENQYSKGVPIASSFIIPKIKGKYVAHCEGDDFWTDPYKLQKQLDIMEENPDCTICVHRVKDYYENGEVSDKEHPNFNLNECKLNLGEYLELAAENNSYPFQTTSYFVRADIKKDYAFNPPEFISKFRVGDIPTLLFALTKGNMYYLNISMSGYRLQAKGSWSSQNATNTRRRVNHLSNLVDGYTSFNKFTNNEYARYIEDICEKDEFLIALLSKEYKTCLSKKYRKYFNEYLSKKEKLAVIIYAVFPFFVK